MKDTITSPQVWTSPSPIDGELTRPKGVDLKFYEKVPSIRRDPTVRLAREFAIAPIIGSSWSIECRPEAPEGAKSFIEDQMAEIRSELLRTSLLGMIDYGWQPYERIVDLTPEYLYGIEEMKPLLQKITTVLVEEQNGKFWGLRQDPVIGATVEYTYLTQEECFVVAQDVEGTNWYGEPTLKAIEGCFDEGDQINKNARRYDKKIAGSHWVIYYPLGKSLYNGIEQDNGVIAKSLINSIEAVGGVAVPRAVFQALDSMNLTAATNESLQWKIELLSDKGGGQQPFIDRLKYLDVLKVRAFGFPERALMEGQFGTKAEAEAHADLAIMNMETKYNALVSQYNRRIVRYLMRLNWGAEYEKSVFLKAAPLADKAVAFLREIYKLVFQNPEGFMNELASLNMQGIREKLGMPILDPMQQPMIDPMTGQAVDPMTGLPIADPYAQDAAMIDEAGQPIMNDPQMEYAA